MALGLSTNCDNRYLMAGNEKEQTAFGENDTVNFGKTHYFIETDQNDRRKLQLFSFRRNSTMTNMTSTFSTIQRHHFSNNVQKKKRKWKSAVMKRKKVVKQLHFNVS